jgi:glyoxylase-like metal-dependent hydrolase (beta-lactamase superfamily II)
MEALPHDVHLVDCHYVRPELAGAYIVRAGGRAALVECNTSLAVPRLLAALQTLGLTRDAVDWVFVTHVHLDHAGGAGALLRELPTARLVVHPKGARHLIDPRRLVEGATSVYGSARMAELYGEIVPVPTERVFAPEDAAVIEVGGRPLQVLHTPGHASHHIAIHDPESAGVFTGDVYGLAYRALATPEGPFLFPSTAPNQLDPPAMLASMARIEALDPRTLYLTHYGAIPFAPRLGEGLRALLSTWTHLARAAVQHHEDPSTMLAALSRQVHFSLWSRYVRALGRPGDEALFGVWMALDADIGSQGLLHWARTNPER